MHATVARAAITDAGRSVIVLNRPGRRPDLDSRTQSVAVAFRSNQLYGEPVIGVLRPVHQNLRLTVQVRHHDIHLAVVVQVAECGAAVCGPREEAAAGTGADIHEGSVSQVPQQQVRQLGWQMIDLLGVVENGGACREQILVAVVVKIEHARSPSRETHRRLRHAGGTGDVLEIPSPVSEQGKHITNHATTKMSGLPSLSMSLKSAP